MNSKSCTKQGRNYLWCDFNFTEAITLDRQNKDNSKDASTSAYSTLIENCDLHDIWREMHPNKKQFTYLDKSRVGKILISEECSNYTQKAHIFQAGIKTDYKYMKIDLNLESNPKGSGRWTLNTSISEDHTYKQNIQEITKAVTNDYRCLCKQMQWEICKIKVREFSIQYCTKKNRL